MAKSSLTLWIDVDTNRVLDGWNSNNEAPVPSFVAGDTCEIEMHLVRKNASSQFEELPTTGKSFKLAIGLIDTLPSGGSFTLAYGNSQIDFDFDEKPADVQTALNLIPEIAAAGGVTVTLVNGGTTYRVMFNQKVALSSTFSTDASNLIPSSIIQKSEVKVGSSTTKAVWHFKPKQVPVVYQPNWTQSTNSSIATLASYGAGGRIEIKPDAPRGGTFSLSAYLYKTKKYPPNQGQLISTSYVTTSPISVNATATDFDNALPMPEGSTDYNINGLTVTKVGAYAWDYSTKSIAAQDGVAWYDYQYYINEIRNGSIIPFEYVYSTISLNNYEVASLLAGIGSAEAVLEVEVTENGAVTTVLQTPCKIISDIIGQHTYSPTPFDDPLTQSDLDAVVIGYAQLSGASFTGTIYTPEIRNLLNTDLIIDSYNDTGAGVHYEHKFTHIDGKFVLATNGGGLTFPDGTTQTTSALPLSGGTMTGNITYGDVNGVTTFATNNGFNVVDSTLGSGATVGYDTFLGVGYIVLNKPSDGTSIEITATGITFPDGTTQTTSAVTPNLSGYALLSGATFTGKVNTTPTSTLAALNLGSQQAAPSSTVAGDLWIGSNINYKSWDGITKAVANTNTTNTFQQPQIIGNSGASAALRITQLGTGAALVVEDSTTPDATSFVIDANGRVGVGVAPSTTAAIKVDAGGIMFGDGTTQFTAATTPDLSGYLTSANAALTYQTIAGMSDYATNVALSTYAPLDGATFTGKVVTTASVSTAPLKIGVSTTAPTTTVAGDIWVGTNNVFFKDSTNTQRALVNQNTQNTFSTNQIISASSTLALLRITQSGTGQAIVVEDATNPDTSAFIVNADGVVGIQKDPATWTPTTGVALDVTGKALFTPSATLAGLNIGSATTDPTSTITGDIWIGTNTLNFRDSTNSHRTLANLNTVNTFSTPQVIQAPTSASLPALRISNSATTAGVHSLVVGDAVNPDTSSFVIDNNGNVGIGVDPATWSPNSKLELNGSIKFTADSSVQTTAYIPSAVAITGGSINGITIDGGTY